MREIKSTSEPPEGEFPYQPSLKANKTRDFIRHYQTVKEGKTDPDFEKDLKEANTILFNRLELFERFLTSSDNTSHKTLLEAQETIDKGTMISALESLDKSCSAYEGNYYMHENKFTPLFTSIQYSARRAYEALKGSLFSLDYQNIDLQYQDNIKKLKEHHQYYTKDPDKYCDNNPALKEKIQKLIKKIEDNNILRFPDNTSHKTLLEAQETIDKGAMISALESLDKSCSAREGNYYMHENKFTPLFTSIQYSARRAHEALKGSLFSLDYQNIDLQYQDNIKRLKEHYQRYTKDPDQHCDNNPALKKEIQKLMKKIEDNNILRFPDNTLHKTLPEAHKAIDKIATNEKRSITKSLDQHNQSLRLGFQSSSSLGKITNFLQHWSILAYQNQQEYQNTIPEGSNRSTTESKHRRSESETSQLAQKKLYRGPNNYLEVDNKESSPTEKEDPSAKEHIDNNSTPLSSIKKEADQPLEITNQYFMDTKRLLNETRQHYNQVNENLIQISFDFNMAEQMYTITNQLLTQAVIHFTRAKRGFNTEPQNENEDYNRGCRAFEDAIQPHGTGRGFWQNSVNSYNQSFKKYESACVNFNRAKTAYDHGDKAHSNEPKADQKNQRKLKAETNKLEVENLMTDTELLMNRISSRINNIKQRKDILEATFNYIEDQWNQVNTLKSSLNRIEIAYTRTNPD